MLEGIVAGLGTESMMESLGYAVVESDDNQAGLEALMLGNTLEEMHGC